VYERNDAQGDSPPRKSEKEKRSHAEKRTIACSRARGRSPKKGR
jgi:hypothetical protein